MTSEDTGFKTTTASSSTYVPATITVNNPTSLAPINVRLELTRAEKLIYDLRGKYIKQTLARIELHEGAMTSDIRKAILDGFNDYCRELTKELGYEARP